MLIVAATLVLQTYNPITASAPQKLTTETFAAVRQHASPVPGELAWQQIDWNDTIAKGVNKARLEDKPIVMWLFFGDPRGSC